jgi:transcriptional regulator with XRE-family HTH domain
MVSKTVPLPVRHALHELGESVRTWRKLQRLTAEQVADRANISRATLRKLESGSGAISLENAFRVLRALGILRVTVDAADPYNSDVGRLRSIEKLPQRVRLN